MPEKNIVEKAIVPRNPSTAKVQNKDKYSLFAPLGGIKKVGIVGYSNDFSIDGNHFVSIRDGAITAAKLSGEIRERFSAIEGDVGYANSLLSSLEGGLNSLAGRVGYANLSEDTRFTTNVLANAILKLSEDLRKTETYPFDVVYRDDEGILYFKNGDTTFASVDLPIETLVRGIRVEADSIILTLENGADVSVPIDAITEKIEEAIFAEELPKAMKDSIVTEGGIEASLEGGKLKLTGGGSGGGGGTIVKVNGEAVSEFDADSKLDAKASPYSGVKSAYYCNADGSQGLVQIGGAVGQIPQRTTNGHITLPTTGFNSSAYAVPKKYVDDTITSRIGDIQSALEELHTYAQSLIGGGAE